MTSSAMRLAWTLGCLAAISVSTASACESVTSAPAILSNGVYCLAADLEALNRPAIELGDDTVLDCKGHKVSIQLQPPGPDDPFEPWVIAVKGSNAVVRNCVVDGGYYGIRAFGNYFRIVDNTIRGFELRAIYQASMYREGLIEGNLIHSIPSAAYDGVIRTYGLVDIVGNVIFGVEVPADLVDGRRLGISTDYNRGGLVARNVVRDILTSAGGAGIAIQAIAGYPVIYRNVLSAIPGRGGYGIVCESSECIQAQNTIVGHPYGLQGVVGVSTSAPSRMDARAVGAH